jgi:hypothetical protein
VTGETEPALDAANSDRRDTEVALVPGRSCGTCGLCCKVYAIAELESPPGQWCRHALPGRGCGIHLERPHVCRQFFCAWRLDPDLGPEWKPDKAHFVVSADRAYQALTITLDPGVPLAWKKEPYYARIKLWALSFFPENKKVLVMNRGHATVVLPDRDVPIGVIVPGEEILIYREGNTYGAKLARHAKVIQAPET